MNFAITKEMSIIEFNEMISSLNRLLRLNLYNLTINAYLVISYTWIYNFKFLLKVSAKITNIKANYYFYFIKIYIKCIYYYNL